MTRDTEQVRQPGICVGRDRGNDRAVLTELYHALETLKRCGKETIVDIKSLPFGSIDEQRLAEFLGKGEVEAVLHALGESRITETAFPGIWWIEHRDEHGEITAKSIEVANIPGILKSQHDDVADACRRLGSLVQLADPDEEPGSIET